MVLNFGDPKRNLEAFSPVSFETKVTIPVIGCTMIFYLILYWGHITPLPVINILWDSGFPVRFKRVIRVRLGRDS